MSILNNLIGVTVKNSVWKNKGGSYTRLREVLVGPNVSKLWDRLNCHLRETAVAGPKVRFILYYIVWLLYCRYNPQIGLFGTITDIKAGKDEVNRMSRDQAAHLLEDLMIEGKGKRRAAVVVAGYFKYLWPNIQNRLILANEEELDEIASI